MSELCRRLEELPAFAEADVKDEAILFSASPEFAAEKGGAITRRLAEKAAGYAGGEGHVVIDTRVHMLRPGWYPGSPGWHLDAVPRDEAGQPDLHARRVEHILICVVDCGAGSTAEFAEAESLPELPDRPPSERTLWGEHDRLINAHDGLRTGRMESGVLYDMSASAYHRAMPATGHGWRYFFRAMVGYPLPPLNEIRRQCNVFVMADQLGW